MSGQYDTKWYKGSAYLLLLGFGTVILFTWLVILTVLISVNFHERTNKFTVNGNMTMNGYVLASNFNNLQGNITALNYTPTGWASNFSSVQTQSLTVAGKPFVIKDLPSPVQIYKTLAHTSYVQIPLPSNVLQTPPITLPIGTVYEGGSPLFTASVSGFFGLSVGVVTPNARAVWDVFINIQEDIFTTCTLQNTLGSLGGSGSGKRFIALPRFSEVLVTGYLYTINCVFSSSTMITLPTVSLIATFNLQVIF